MTCVLEVVFCYKSVLVIFFYWQISHSTNVKFLCWKLDQTNQRFVRNLWQHVSVRSFKIQYYFKGCALRETTIYKSKYSKGTHWFIDFCKLRNQDTLLNFTFYKTFSSCTIYSLNNVYSSCKSILLSISYNYSYYVGF